jgi:hypothetical protein
MSATSSAPNAARFGSRSDSAENFQRRWSQDSYGSIGCNGGGRRHRLTGSRGSRRAIVAAARQPGIPARLLRPVQLGGVHLRGLRRPLVQAHRLELSCCCFSAPCSSSAATHAAAAAVAADVPLHQRHYRHSQDDQGLRRVRPVQQAPALCELVISAPAGRPFWAENVGPVAR